MELAPARPPVTLPRGAGIGFKPEHFHDLLSLPPPARPAFVEVHAENYMGAGGAAHAMLTAIRACMPLSVHGVGLSIGGPGPLDAAHLARLAAVAERWQPQAVSEHLAWSTHDGAYLNDLLPLPYTAATLAGVAAHVAQVQDRLKRRILIENPATYILFAASTWSETDFLAELVRRTGCGLLLDVNNVYVSCTNHRESPEAYLDAFPLAAVGQIHLAGHAAEELPSGPLLIDDHGSPVAEPVHALYARVLARTGPLPTLIEWDTDVPALPVLMAEAARAEAALAAAREAAHGA